MKTPAIKEVRLERGLKQSELAEAAGTSTRKIARLEAGIQPCRLSLAQELARALGSTIERLFPKSAKLLAKLPIDRSPTDAEYQALNPIGLDVDARYWTVHLYPRGAKSLIFAITSAQYRRLFGVVQRTEGVKEKYVVFDSEERRIAVNLGHVLVCHFTFEGYADRVETDDGGEYLAKLQLADSSEELTFHLDGDDIPADEDDVQDLENVFYSIDTWADGGAEEPLVCRFDERGGEDVSLRMDDTAAFSVPLEAVEPTGVEDYNEDEAPDRQPPAGYTPAAGEAQGVLRRRRSRA
jgi:transcriptional regulator with XRE-family HTH domain